MNRRHTCIALLFALSGCASPDPGPGNYYPTHVADETVVVSAGYFDLDLCEHGTIKHLYFGSDCPTFSNLVKAGDSIELRYEQPWSNQYRFLSMQIKRRGVQIPPGCGGPELPAEATK
jgi:hypothetical protein